MKPISIERVQWLRERLKVVERCFNIARANAHGLQGSGVAMRDIQTVLQNFSSERIAIEIELRVLSEYVADIEAQENRETVDVLVPQ